MSLLLGSSSLNVSRFLSNLVTSAFLIEGANFFIDAPFARLVFSRLAVGLLAGASLAALAVPAGAGTKRPVRWNTGGAVWTTTSKDFKAFFKSGEINDRALDAGISNSLSLIHI